MRISDWSSDVFSSDLIPDSLLQIDGARPRPLNRNISALDRDCGIALGRPVRADLADHQKAGLRIELPPVSAVPRRPGGAQDHVEVPGRILMELREILIAHRIYAAARLVGRQTTSCDLEDWQRSDCAAQEIGRASCRERVCQYV